MGEGGVATLAKAAAARPVLAVPPRNVSESFVRGGPDSETPSPMTFVSSFLAENEPFIESKPLSSLLAGSLGSQTFAPLGGESAFFSNFDSRGSACDMQTFNKQSENSGRDGFVTSQGLRPSGFSAKYKSMMPSRLPIPSTTTYLTIPPGLSPTTLLDSPVLFNAGLADPSPTTGSYSIAPKSHDSLLPACAESARQKESNFKQQDSFIFKPHPLPATTQQLSVNSTDCFGVSYQPAFRQLDGQVQSQLVSRPPGDASIPASIESTFGDASGFSCSGENSQKPLESTAPIAKPLEIGSASQLSDLAPQCMREKTSADGYNWKKYGQKQLKGTEYPRSYYKCTHPNCPVKKQVECSHEGEITEILYKGEHNHTKPQGTRRGARNVAHTWETSERGGHSSALERAGEAASALERTDSDRFSTELSSSSLALSHGGLAGTPEQSFCSPSIEEGDDVEASKAEDDCEDEQDSKRRRTENFRETLSSAPIRTIREPRVVVQTTSEVDILDDGYRWRKYGQKVVKGNHFPRSYYKCTNIGCIVRKHVERSSTDPTSVITAYEGKHNHNVPAARGSFRETGGATAGPPPVPTYAAMGVSSSDMVARPSTLYETRELGSFVENSFNGVNQFTVDMASTRFSDYDGNGGEGLGSSMSAARAMGLNLSGMRPFGVGELNAQGLGLSLLQPMYPSSSSSCVAEEDLSRS